MNDSDIILNFYVRGIVYDDDGDKLYFTVVHTNAPTISSTVTRFQSKDAMPTWACACRMPQVICPHIYRAMLYYRDMLERTKDLKDQLKIRKEMREQPTAKKRLIRLQGE